MSGQSESILPGLDNVSSKHIGQMCCMSILPLANAQKPGEGFRLLWHGLGWSPLETRFFIDNGRDWLAVEQYYLDVVSGEATLSSIGVTEVLDREGALAHAGLPVAFDLTQLPEYVPSTAPSSKQKASRRTYAAKVAYYGPAFPNGWVWASQLEDTAQAAVQQALAVTLNVAPGQQVIVDEAGRTDKGVSACGQVISFYSWHDVPPEAVAQALSSAKPGALRALHVQRMPRSFHATYSAAWRRYIYLFPLQSSVSAQDSTDSSAAGTSPAAEDCCSSRSCSDVICASAVDRLLKALEGRTVDFYAYARDTPKGKATECIIYSASARSVQVPGCSVATPALCFEVTANRFLRRMMRVLVSTALRESTPAAAACPEAGDSALLRLAEARDRLQTAPPAPAVGLCLVGVGYRAPGK